MVEIPKGSYSIVFHSRPHEPARPLTEPVEIAPAVLRRGPASSAIVLVLSLALLGAFLLIGVLILDRAKAHAKAPAVTPPPTALESLWRGFLDTPDEPWVIFSNAEFVGRPETGMHYFRPGIDRSSDILDHYTGVGEVLGIHELDHMFTEFHHELRVKRGRLLSLDDALNNDLIFVGSPSENLPLRDIPNTREFVFRRMTTGKRKGDLEVWNVHPQSGEPPAWAATPHVPLAEDYAVVGLMPGLDSSHWVMVLAGITTIGTQAAAEFVSRPNSVQGLLHKLAVPPTGRAVPFEAVLHVQVSRGVPVQTELVALRRR